MARPPHVPAALFGLVLAVCTGVSALAAQTAPRPAPTATAEAEVRRDFAARWDEPADRIALEWGALAGSVEGAAVATVQNGAGSSWIVVFRDGAGRQTGSVRVRAGVHGVQPVAAREIARGELLDAAAIAAQPVVRWGPPSAALAPEGWVARRRIAAGEVLAAPAVAAPDLVRSGEGVRLVVESGTVTLTAAATALGSGGLGARVAVRTDSGRRIDTTVTGPGEVRIRGMER